MKSTQQSDPSCRLSVIIPAYNEEARILQTLKKVDAYLNSQSYGWEVIIVDDCSVDHTEAVVQDFIRTRLGYRMLRNERNVGKGGSVRNGVAAAKGQFILFSDADLSTPIEEVANFLALIENGFDVVIGSRRVKGANVAKRQPFFRELAGRIFSVLVRFLTLPGFIDTQCGFKMFAFDAAKEIFIRQTILGFGFDVELLFIAHKRGYKVKEAPVAWYDSPLTRVRFFRDSTRMFTDLLLIRWNNWKGRYN